MIRRLRLPARLRDVGRDRRGNILMIFAFALMPLTFATGMGIDYGQAMRLQTKLNAAADAAALSATSQDEMGNTFLHAATRAKTMFRVQVDGSLNLFPINYIDPAQFSIIVVDTPTATGITRVATVSYRGESQNMFGKILGRDSLTIKGTAVASASTAPNIDFFLLLDVSGSMALPTTTAGLTTLQGATGGCAFACHSTNDAKAYDKYGKYTDYYGVARSYGIPLRIDEEGKATQSLMTTAKSTQAANGATYRMSISTFSEGPSSSTGTQWKNIQFTTTDLDAAGTKAATASVSLYDRNGCPTASRCNNDTDSAPSDAFDNMNTLMPTPGTGSKIDKPQAIMFVISDGMRDEKRADGKPEVTYDLTRCQAIKDRGIRIAVLYTEYLPATIANDSWSTSPTGGNVYNRLPQIEPNLQACASSGLYYKVSTDGDITAALNSLFQQAVATSHLTR